MVKKFSSRKKAPLASLESLISIETCGEENNINCVRWSDQEKMDRETDLQTDLETDLDETDLDLTSLPWNSPSWQRTSVSRQNCQVYQVNSFTEIFQKHLVKLFLLKPKDKSLSVNCCVCI